MFPIFHYAISLVLAAFFMPKQSKDWVLKNASGNIATLYYPGIISTNNVESSIALTPDEKILFVSRYSGEWGSSNNSPSKIYTYQRKGKQWFYEGISPFSNADTEHSDSDIFISYDGKSAFFISNRPYPGKQGKGGDIWKVEKKGRKWGKALPLKELNTDGYEASPVTDRKGNLYFSSIRTVGKGQGDLYMAKLNNDGTYQTPIPLAGEINSQHGEWNLLVSPDADWIIFESSSRPDGLSSYGDLYLSIFIENRWSKPQHLYQLNTTGSELNVRFSPKSGSFFFASSSKLANTDCDIFLLSQSIIKSYLPN